MRQVKRKEKNLVHEKLAAFPEEAGLAGKCRSFAARCRQAATIEKCVADGCEIQKRAIAKDGVVAFQLVAIERIPRAAVRVGAFAANSITIPIRHRNRPAIGIGLEYQVGWGQ